MELCQVEVWATELHGGFAAEQSCDNLLEQHLHCLQEDVCGNVTAPRAC